MRWADFFRGESDKSAYRSAKQAQVIREIVQKLIKLIYLLFDGEQVNRIEGLNIYNRVSELETIGESAVYAPAPPNGAE